MEPHKPESSSSMSKELVCIKPAPSKTRPDHSCAQITISEFLNFLKTAYQVQDTIEGVLTSGGMTEAVNWLKLKENELSFRQKTICCQTSDTIMKNPTEEKSKELVRRKSSTTSQDSDLLKRKLNEVLSEGLLDSVLPYLIQNATIIKRGSSSAIIKITEKQAPSLVSVSNSITSEVKLDKSRRSSDASVKNAITKNDSDVEIHVCDELKSLKKTFVCNQKLLVEKMGYFAEVTLGKKGNKNTKQSKRQRLEDMDISVHCDIGIFEWLMQWVKKESLLEADWPQLDAQCVIPILVSAAFLQMEPLLNDCLLFCHEHMNEILRTSTNLTCLNDSVLTRLAAMYTNVEVESIKDRKDKVQSRLFSKLIQSLAEPEAESVRGHWCSSARVFRCEKCQQLITPSVAAKIPCVPPCMRLQPDGSIISLHVRDPTWDINEYILKLQKSLKTWRRVYWRLWGDAHFLYCLSCKRYFPANQVGWCRYHPDTPQFFSLDTQKAPLPIGRYPCCGERAYRFQLMENYSGCQFRQHMVCTQDVRDSAIFAMLENFRHLIEEQPPQLLFPERLTRLVARDPSSTEKRFICKESFWWDGFELIPPRPKLGLLSNFANRLGSGGDGDFASEAFLSEESSEEYTEDEESVSSTSAGSDEGSAESNPQSKMVTIKRKTKKANEGKLWQHNLSARSNQDIQRAHEETVLKEMTAFLNKKVMKDTLIRKAPTRNGTPIGGIWVRLEAEWKELTCQNSQSKNKSSLVTKFRPRGKFT